MRLVWCLYARGWGGGWFGYAGKELSVVAEGVFVLLISMAGLVRGWACYGGWVRVEGLGVKGGGWLWRMGGGRGWIGGWL